MQCLNPRYHGVMTEKMLANLDSFCTFLMCIVSNPESFGHRAKDGAYAIVDLTRGPSGVYSPSFGLNVCPTLTTKNKYPCNNRNHN